MEGFMTAFFSSLRFLCRGRLFIAWLLCTFTGFSVAYRYFYLGPVVHSHHVLAALCAVFGSFLLILAEPFYLFLIGYHKIPNECDEQHFYDN
jgi:hypothetical protein